MRRRASPYDIEWIMRGFGGRTACEVVEDYKTAAYHEKEIAMKESWEICKRNRNADL